MLLRRSLSQQDSSGVHASHSPSGTIYLDWRLTLRHVQRGARLSIGTTIIRLVPIGRKKTRWLLYAMNVSLALTGFILVLYKGILIITDPMTRDLKAASLPQSPTLAALNISSE